VQADVEDVDDVRVLDRGGDAGLAQEALFDVLGEAVDQDLDRDLAAQTLVLGLVDARHAAGADARAEHERPEARALGEGRLWKARVTGRDARRCRVTPAAPGLWRALDSARPERGAARTRSLLVMLALRVVPLPSAASCCVTPTSRILGQPLYSSRSPGWHGERLAREHRRPRLPFSCRAGRVAKLRDVLGLSSRCRMGVFARCEKPQRSRGGFAQRREQPQVRVLALTSGSTCIRAGFAGEQRPVR
jgi:hypothetical protein